MAQNRQIRIQCLTTDELRTARTSTIFYARSIIMGINFGSGGRHHSLHRGALLSNDDESWWVLSPEFFQTNCLTAHKDGLRRQLIKSMAYEVIQSAFFKLLFISGSLKIMLRSLWSIDINFHEPLVGHTPTVDGFRSALGESILSSLFDFFVSQNDG